jgi:hypothetical protein
MGTFGWMEVGGYKTYTVERPWNQNQPFISCIPEGLYHVQAHNSPKFGRCWILEGGTVGHYVGVRTHILIHAANTSDQLQGCIAPGLSLGALGGKWAVLSSKSALARIKENMPSKWDLYITSIKNDGATYTPA